MKAVRATAALLAGAALTLAFPVQAQWSQSSGSSAIFHAPAAGSPVGGSDWSSPGPFSEEMRRGGASDGERDRRRPRRDRYGQRYGWQGGFYLPGGGYVYDDPGFGPDRGYFSQNGERPLKSGGQAYFDYDRGYPYEHYNEPRHDEDRRLARAEPSCEMAWTRDLSNGDLVPVRVCRN